MEVILGGERVQEPGVCGVVLRLGDCVAEILVSGDCVHGGGDLGRAWSVHEKTLFFRCLWPREA